MGLGLGLGLGSGLGSGLGLGLSLTLILALPLILTLTLTLTRCFGPLRLVFAHYVKHAAAVPAATSPQEGRLHAALDRRGRGGGGGGGGGGGAAAAAHAMSWAQLQGFAQSVTLLRKSFDLHNLARLSAMLVGAEPEARLPLYLPCISPASYLHTPYISRTSPLHLPCISLEARLLLVYLRCISPISPLHLPRISPAPPPHLPLEARLLLVPYLPNISPVSPLHLPHISPSRRGSSSWISSPSSCTPPSRAATLATGPASPRR